MISRELLLLNYYQDCVETLRRGPLRPKDSPIIINADYRASVAKARAAEVKRLRHDRQDVSYGLQFLHGFASLTARRTRSLWTSSM